MVSSVLLALLLSGLMIDGLPSGVLEWQNSGVDAYGNTAYEIALSFDDGVSFSEWALYPLYFNPAKSFCRYSSVDSSIEVISQLPFSGEYTYAWYSITASGSLLLFDEGKGSYYETFKEDVYQLLESGQFEEACDEAYCLMYPGAMPEPDSFCARFVIAAAEIGTLDAFGRAAELSLQIANIQFYLLDDSSVDYINALKDYAEMSDEATAVFVMERLAEYE